MVSALLKVPVKRFGKGVSTKGRFAGLPAISEFTIEFTQTGNEARFRQRSLPKSFQSNKKIDLDNQLNNL